MSAKVQGLNDFLALLRGVKQARDGQYLALCPGHHDTKPSLSVKEAEGKILVQCFAGCELKDILKKLGLEPKDLFFDSHKTQLEHREIEAIYRYTDANGKPFEVVRIRPKGFYQRRPDGKGGYITNLKGIVPTLYRQDEVRWAVDNTKPIYFVEGEKDVEQLRSLGLVATTNPMGAGKWRNSYSEILRGADLVIIPDNDGPGRDHANQVAKSTYGMASRVRLLELPSDCRDVSAWLDKGGSIEQLQQLVFACPDYKPKSTEQTYPPVTLEQILEHYRSYLFMPDTGAIEILLGAVAANLLPGDPVWLLLVGPPGWGKTETLNMLTKIEHIHPVAVLTEASLLSGTPRRDSQGAKGGLLREMGDFGVLLIKDFGGVLSLTRETRGPILAALREVYDGAWTRYVGSDGGRTLAWAGKVGLVGGATPAIDQHYAVIATLGERFCYYCMMETDDRQRAESALAQAGREAEMRNELATLVASLFVNVDISDSQPALAMAERDKLVALAIFTTRCRSAVERDSYQSREIQLIPGVESPTRLVKVLSQLLRGLQVIGVTKQRAWELVTKVALDSMPALRQRVVMAMLEGGTETTTSDLATKLGYPTNTTRRTLENLACYGVTKRQSQGEGRADVWSLTDWVCNAYTAATITLPEIPDRVSTEPLSLNQTNNLEFSISGKVDLDDIPDYPTHRCRNCGCADYWLTDWNTWLCSRCHPEPEVSNG